MQACPSKENAGPTRSRQQPLNGGLLLTLSLGFLVLACSTERMPSVHTVPHALTADEALAVQSLVTDCEWKAADQYDDGRYTVSELAQRVMGVCAVELTKAALAFGLSPNDPQIVSDQFKQAVENVESARKARRRGAKNSN
jgi:hypothetical protein